MKITKSYLKQLIKEELDLLNEQDETKSQILQKQLATKVQQKKQLEDKFKTDIRAIDQEMNILNIQIKTSQQEEAAAEAAAKASKESTSPRQIPLALGK